MIFRKITKLDPLNIKIMYLKSFQHAWLHSLHVMHRVSSVIVLAWLTTLITIHWALGNSVKAWACRGEESLSGPLVNFPQLWFEFVKWQHRAICRKPSLWLPLGWWWSPLLSMFSDLKLLLYPVICGLCFLPPKFLRKGQKKSISNVWCKIKPHVLHTRREQE